MPRPSSPDFRRLRRYVWSAAAGLILGTVMILAAGCDHERPGGGNAIRLGALSELPANVRQAPVAVREAYQFAVVNSDVLRQIPCYCGCGAMGHRSNAACYLADGAPGTPLRFEEHALGCSLCVDITQDVMRLMRRGTPLPEIRRYVDSTYARYGPSNQP
jgi:hypothetical protein